MANRVQIIFDALDRTDPGFKGLNGNLERTRTAMASVRSVAALLGVGLGALSVKELAAEVYDAGMKWQGMSNAMLAATGSAPAAAAGLDFVRAEAKRLGLDLEVSAKGFSQLSAAAKGTSIGGAALREIFLGVSEASTVLSLSSADSEGALRAITQIMSKGTVQAEELRGQLGERIPGAFQIAARAMGVTTKELNKMLEQGQVLSDEFLPKFAAELRRTYADALPTAMQSARAESGRLKTAWMELMVVLGDTGFMDGVTQAIGSTAEAIDRLRRAIRETSQETFDRLRLELQATEEQLDKASKSSGFLQFFYGGIDHLEEQAAKLRAQIAALHAEMDKGKPDDGAAAGGTEPVRTKEQLEALTKFEEKLSEQKANALQKRLLAVDRWAREERKLLEAAGLKEAEIQQRMVEVHRVAQAKKAEISQEFREKEAKGYEELAARIAAAQDKLRADETAQLEQDVEGILEAYRGLAVQLESTGGTMANITSGLTLYNNETDRAAEKTKEMGERAGLTFEAMENAVEGWASGFSGQLNDIFWSADLTFSAILESFGRMLSQMVIQKQIVEPLLGAGMGFMEGLFNAPAASGGGFTPTMGTSGFSLSPTIKHDGGPIVPRFHFGGLLPDEVPAILQTGERVLSREQNRTFDRLAAILDGSGSGAVPAGSAVEVNVINNAQGAQARTEERQQGGKRIVDVIVETVEGAMGSGRLDRALGNNYGVTRAGIRR